MKTLKPRIIAFPDHDHAIHSSIDSLNFQSFIECISDRKELTCPVIFITGYSGAGKTDFSDRCSSILDDCAVIHLDDFGITSLSTNQWLIDVEAVHKCIADIKESHPKLIIIEGIGDNIDEMISSLNLKEIYFLHSSSASFSKIMDLKASQYQGESDEFRSHWLRKSRKSVFWIKNFILSKYLEFTKHYKVTPVFNDIQTTPTHGWAESKGYIM